MRCGGCSNNGGSSATAFSRRRGGLGGGLRTWSRAAAKAASARLRDGGTLAVSPDARERLAVCRRCPLRVVHDGAEFCGKPLWQRDRGDEPGCGCPLVDKARDPAEHCPLAAESAEPGFSRACRWCAAVATGPRPGTSCRG